MLNDPETAIHLRAKLTDHQVDAWNRALDKANRADRAWSDRIAVIDTELLALDEKEESYEPRKQAELARLAEQGQTAAKDLKTLDRKIARKEALIKKHRDELAEMQRERRVMVDPQIGMIAITAAEQERAANSTPLTAEELRRRGELRAMKLEKQRQRLGRMRPLLQRLNRLASRMGIPDDFRAKIDPDIDIEADD